MTGVGSPEAPEPQPTYAGEPPPAVQRTGEPRVDEALDRLEGITQAPLAEHVAAYDEVHRLLQDALADVDER